MKKLFTNLALVAITCLLGFAQGWAQDVVYQRGGAGTPWSDADIPEWVGASGFTIDEALIHTSKNAGWEATKSLDIANTSIVTMSAEFWGGQAPGRSGSYDYITIGGVSLRFNGQDKKASVVVDGVETALSGFVRGGSYNLNVTIDQANNTITYSVSGGASGSATVSSPTKVNGVTIGHFRAGSEGYEIVEKLISIEVTEEKQAVAEGDYTINYVCDGEAIQDPVEGTGVVGNTVVVSHEPIVKDGVKYIYVSDNSEENPITAEGVTITVTYRKAEIYEFSVVAVDGEGTALKTIVTSASCYEGDSYAVAYPQYVLAGTTLYKIKEGSPNYFSMNVTPTTNDEVIKLEYKDGIVENVAVYTEGENVLGVNVATSENRASNGHMGYTGDPDQYKEIAGIEPGVYVIYARGVNSNKDTRTCNFKVGEDVVYTFSISNGTNILGNSEEFTVTKYATLSFASDGSSISGLDWVYIQKTGEYEAPAPEMPEAFAIPEDGSTIDGDLMDAMFALFFGDPIEFKYAAGCEDPTQIEITINGEALEFETDWTAEYYVEDEVMYPNGTIFVVNPESVKNGEMVVTIPAGAFTVYVWDADEEAIVDIVGTYDEEIVLHYTLENFPEQTVEPEPVETVEPVIVPSYTADTFEGIIIGFPGAEMADVNGALLYSDEITLRDATWSYYAESFDMTQDETTFYLVPDPTPNISGTYTLSLPEGLFTVDGAPSAETTVELTFEGFDPTVTFSVMPDGELEYEDFVSPENWNSTIGLMMSIEPGEVDVYAEEAENYLEKISVTMNGEALANGTDWTITRYEVDMSVDEEELILEAPNMFNIWINPEKIVDGEITVTIAEGAFNLHNFDMDYWEAYGDLGQSEAYSFTLTIINKPTDGISSVIANGVSTADVYTTSGVMVRKAGESLNGLAKGVYVTKGVKVLVK